MIYFNPYTVTVRSHAVVRWVQRVWGRGDKCGGITDEEMELAEKELRDALFEVHDQPPRLRLSMEGRKQYRCPVRYGEGRGSWVTVVVESDFSAVHTVWRA